MAGPIEDVPPPTPHGVRPGGAGSRLAAGRDPGRRRGGSAGRPRSPCRTGCGAPRGGGPRAPSADGGRGTGPGRDGGASTDPWGWKTGLAVEGGRGRRSPDGAAIRKCRRIQDRRGRKDGGRKIQAFAKNIIYKIHWKTTIIQENPSLPPYQNHVALPPRRMLASRGRHGKQAGRQRCLPHSLGW